MERDNENDEDEAAFVDAFFLPGGILDPEEDNNKNDDTTDDDLTPSLLFPSAPASWLDSGASVPTQADSTTTPWFGERLLMTESTETATATRPNNTQDLVVDIVPSSPLEPPKALLKPILLESLSPSSTGESSLGLVTAGKCLDSIPDWIPLSQRQTQQQAAPQKSAVVSQPASTGSALHPPPPPGFENSLLHSSKTSSAFSPPAKSKARRQQQQSTKPQTTPKRTESSGWFSGTVASAKDEPVPEPKKPGYAKSKKPGDKNATPKQQQETASATTPSYRAAVVSKQPVSTNNNNKASPKKSQDQRKTNQQPTNQGQPDQTGRTKAAVPFVDGSEDGSVAASSHNSQGGGSRALSDPSSNYSIEDDEHVVLIDGDDEYHISHRSEESEWSQIVRSPQSRAAPTAATTTPRLGVGSSTISSKDAFSVFEDDEETEKSVVAETDVKEVKSIIPQQQQQQQQQTKAATSQPGTSKQKSTNTRRQQKIDSTPKTNEVVRSESDKMPDGLDSFLGMFVSATVYTYECVLYMCDILSHVFMWIYEILIPALRQSVLTTASSAMHSLRGIFLLLLAAFHAYSFAADETLAQINLESAWIPYVSLVYAPTATRHVMNFVDLPHFTPHLVSSAVLCFLFRRPGGASNAKRGPGKPTTEDIRNFLLRCCQLFIPFDLVMDGFSSVNTSIMTLSYTDRLLLAYVICVVRKGWMLVPCAWLSFAAQCLVAVYFPWKHILAEPILLFVLFSIGMASLNVLRILEHWKQRAKKAIGKNA